jgi:hypothetical protein
VPLFVSAAYLLILLLAPALPIAVSFASRGLKADQVLLLPLLGVILLAHGRQVLRAAAHPVGAVLWLFAVSAMASSLWSAAFVPGAAAGALIASTWGATRVPLVFTLAFALVSRVSQHGRRWVPRIVIALGAITVCVSILQLIGGNPIHDLTIQHYARKGDFDAVVEGFDLGRVYGTFDGQPNVFGTFMVLCIALAVSTWLRRTSWMAVASAVLFGFGLTVSWSRGAYAGGLAALVVVAVLSGRRRLVRFLMAGGMLSIAVLLMVPEGTKHRFELLLAGKGYGNESIFETRRAFWAQNLALFKSSPLFGVRGMDAPPFDNLLIALAVTQGVIGLAIFMFALWRAWKLCHRIGSADAHPLSSTALGLAAATVGFLVNGMSIPTFFGERVQEAYWFLMGAVAAPLSERLAKRGTAVDYPNA